MAHPWLMLLLGLAGIAAGLALPFAPVWAETTTLTWPAPGEPVRSSTAIVVPYRPTHLTVTVPCSALRGPGVVFATGTGADGLVVTGGSARFGGRTVPLPVVAGADCRAVLDAGADGVSVTAPDGRRTDLPAQPVPTVFGFRTDLAPRDAAGLTAAVRVTDPFATSPGRGKIALILAQLLATATALAVLSRAVRLPRRGRLRLRPVWWIDVAVVVLLAGWAVIGPLAVDDGWATTIARNVADTGSPGNYYRWWNAPEVPFALGQELLAPLTRISIAPLWLRLPSTLLAIATWFVLSRGVLGAVLPVRSATVRVRLLAAAFLLAAWLPFNLGTRPESLVALGVTVVLALAIRARTPAGLGALVLAAALTVPVSPNGVLILAPVLVFAPRLWAALKSHSPNGIQLLANALLLACVGALGLTVIFADQSWDALVTATDWHTFFGPSLPWYAEPDRYRYLLQADQQGSFAKRLPVLVAVAMAAVVLPLAYRRRDRDAVGRVAIRLAAVVVVALGLFALSPSKWSYHLGAAAGPFAALLTVAVVLVTRRARAPGRSRVIVGLVGSALLIGAVTVAFHGPNAWWLPAVYDVPWATEAPRPLDHPLVWVAVAIAGSAVLAARHRDRCAAAAVRAPAVIAVTAVGVVVALLVGSFVAAPLRRQAGSLALVNLHRLTAVKVCGLADDVQVLPDGPVLARSADGVDQLAGFTAQGGYPAGADPPDPPGTGTSTALWGSRSPDARATGTMTTAWFLLPPQPADGGVAVSISGRTDHGNGLALEFGRSGGGGIAPLGVRSPDDRPAADEDPARPLWRSVGVDGADIPTGADRVRVTATDGRTDELGWLAVTGPRLRSVIPLTRFLADRGPVLVAWPQSFLFPCVHDTPTVSGGVAQTPRTVVESPRPWLTEDRDATIGGTFHELEVFGDLHEVPTRLVGAPGVDWGSLFVSGDTAAPDAYLRTVRRDPVPGIGGVAHPPPEH